ncbi:MAG: sporulation protein YqfD [Lachnospiraceae bacterium]
MEFPDFLAGYVRIQVSGDAWNAFNLCAYHRLKLWRLLPEAEAYTACISVRDFRKLKTLVKKSHVRLRITERHGLPFYPEISQEEALGTRLSGSGLAFTLAGSTCMENYSEWKCAADFSGSV